ncbi:universal stress protein [Salinigranum halophilum]|uniref:universal stress protein n=1 Tax=Salinigranum halophilum TaxID=2565931 RepID=UPI0010A8F96F|nr:universal stress protein [Salinigranum halophilum]
MYERILVPTDGSDHALRAADHGRYLADAFDATVHVLAVIDVQQAAGPFSAGGVDKAFIDRLEAEADATVEAVVDTQDGSASVQTAVRKGEPAEEILAYADDHDVDLLAMGTHGRSGLRRLVAGSVTERVVRLAEVPVLTVRSLDRSRVADGYDDVLVPTDGSEPAAAAVDHALEIAAHTGARVHAVYVADAADRAERAADASGNEPDTTPDSRGAAAARALAEQARARGVDALTTVLEGAPAAALLDYADEHDIDLVVMGTRGRAGLSRLVLGSTTGRVLRGAEMPVVSVNARQE